MAQSSKIQWTEKSWNPVRGCTRVSPGCQHCYAELQACAFPWGKGYAVWTGKKRSRHPHWTGRVELLHRKLSETSRIKKSSMFFVNSTSDLFHEKLPIEEIKLVFEAMNRSPWHIYQILTKRSARLAELSPQLSWAPHIWMGVSVESPAYVPRIDDLRRCGAAIKFVSCEPLLEPLPDLKLDGIDWVIIGGESGSHARPMELAWALEIVKQCRRSGVPVFVKQLGAAWAKTLAARHKKGGELSEWPECLRIREWPKRL